MSLFYIHTTYTRWEVVKMSDGPVAIIESNTRVPRTYRAFLVAAVVVGLIVMALTNGNPVASVGAFFGVMALPLGFMWFINLF